MSARMNSAVVIARLLDSEGFTDHLANGIESYWRKNAKLTDGQVRRIARLERAITDMCSKLSVPEKLALGKFIGFQKKMSFETGLRIGMTAFLVKANAGESSPDGDSDV